VRQRRVDAAKCIHHLLLVQQVPTAGTNFFMGTRAAFGWNPAPIWQKRAAGAVEQQLKNL